MTQITAAARKSMRAATPQSISLLARLFAAWNRRQRLRRDQAWLQNQPDYLLRDIGIGRSEIESIIHRGRYR